MKNKFLNAEFGYCPRVLCDRQVVVPVAMSEDLSISRVKVYCPKCEDVYVPRNRFVDIDGAYFGKSFPNVFFQTFPDLLPKDKMVRYTPKIFGFKIFGMPGSKYEKIEEWNSTYLNVIFFINNFIFADIIYIYKWKKIWKKIKIIIE